MQISFIVTRDKAPTAIITALFAVLVISLPRYTDTARTGVLLFLSLPLYIAISKRAVDAETDAARQARDAPP